ncbi:MAG: exodeoxyribonuclease VII small subunit [Erysipelotrichales bacterium]
MENKSFEEAMKRIEEVVALLSDNELALDDSIKLYQEGIELTSYCYNKLNEVEKQSIKILEENQINKLKEEVDTNE